MPCVFETCWTPCFHAGAGHQGLASERLESRWQIVGRCRWLSAELQDDHLLLAAILADPGQLTNPTSTLYSTRSWWDPILSLLSFFSTASLLFLQTLRTLTSPPTSPMERWRSWYFPECKMPPGGWHQPGWSAEQCHPRCPQHPQGQRHHCRAKQPLQHHRAHQHERRDRIQGSGSFNVF